MDPIDRAVLSTNLRRIRAAAGKSQTAVAAAAGLSRVGYRNIETGEAEPRVDTLMHVAAALGVSLPELLVPVRILQRVRFRARRKMATREDILARVARQLDDYSELESLLGGTLVSSLEPIQRALRNNDPVRAAKVARSMFGLDEQDLIRDICGLLEDHGVKVLTPRVASEGFFGLSVGQGEGGPAVVVNTWDRISVERWIFTAAHELGHLVLHHDAYDVDEAGEDEGQEKEADEFASHFLMPENVFWEEWEETRGLPLLDRLFKVKRIFRVSYQSVLYRVASREADKRRRERLWITARSELKRRLGRSVPKTEEPEALPHGAFSGGRGPAPPARVAEEPERLGAYDFVEDRLSRLVRQAYERDLISLSRGAEILGITSEEMRERSALWDSV